MNIQSYPSGPFENESYILATSKINSTISRVNIKMGDLEIANYICKSRSTRIELITFIHITEGTDIILTMSYRSGFGSPKPVEMGKEYEVEISEISRRGDGIARIQGFVIFVEGAKSGQKANIRITSVGDRFAKAQLV